MEKAHFEILLEDINSKFQIVLESHEALRKEIRTRCDESDAKHDVTAFRIDTLNQKIDGVKADLSEKIDGFEDRLSARIDKLDTKVGKLESKVDKLESKIDDIASDLSAHRADTEAHHSIYCVKEP